MTIRELSIVLGILLIGTNVSAQHYFIVNSDTTFCTELEYTTTAQGYLKSIKYIDETGEETYIKGRKKVPDVETFYINGVSIDKIPLKAHKPDSYIRYTERVVDGKLKVYLAQQGYNSTMQLRRTPGFPDDYTTGGPVGSYRFFLKMPDGTFYKINKKKNIKKYIKPYLLKCEEFKEKYKGDFSTKEIDFKETISLYNYLCSD